MKNSLLSKKVLRKKASTRKECLGDLRCRLYKDEKIDVTIYKKLKAINKKHAIPLRTLVINALIPYIDTFNSK